MKRPNNQTIVGIFLIIFLIILGTLFIKLMKNNSKCEGNPFLYGAQKTAEQGLDVMCSCTPLNPNYASFYFDKDGLTIQRDFGSGNNYLNISFNP